MVLAARVCCGDGLGAADAVVVPLVAAGWSFQEWAIHKYLLHGLEVGVCNSGYIFMLCLSFSVSRAMGWLGCPSSAHHAVNGSLPSVALCFESRLSLGRSPSRQEHKRASNETLVLSEALT